MIFKDDRTQEQKRTHTVLIAGYDKFMSGWGKGKGPGGSWAAWACEQHNAERVYRWVKNRGDISRIRQRSDSWVPDVAMHFHIYVVDDNHPALH